MINVNEILLYTTKDGEIKVDVLYGDQNIWLTQKKMALLFGVQIPAINKHLKNIFESGELIEESVISILETTAASVSSPVAKIPFRYLLTAGTLTPKSTARAFWVNQTVSLRIITSSRTAPFGVV